MIGSVHGRVIFRYIGVNVQVVQVEEEVVEVPWRLPEAEHIIEKPVVDLKDTWNATRERKEQRLACEGMSFPTLSSRQCLEDLLSGGHAWVQGLGQLLTLCRTLCVQSAPDHLNSRLPAQMYQKQLQQTHPNWVGLFTYG